MKWLALAFLLAGCMSTRPEQWGPAADDPSLKRAIYECKADTDARMRSAAAFGGAIVPLVSLFNASGNFDECMESRGWRKAE